MKPGAWFVLPTAFAVMASEVLQLVLLTAVGLMLGWGPKGSFVAVVVLLLLGTVAFSGLGLLMAGTLRAEATLPAANLIFILLLGAGGVVVPLDRFPTAAQGGLGLLPITALADGLREVLQHGNSLPLADVGILAAWAVIGVGRCGIPLPLGVARQARVNVLPQLGPSCSTGARRR